MPGLALDGPDLEPMTRSTGHQRRAFRLGRSRRNKAITALGQAGPWRQGTTSKFVEDLQPLAGRRDFQELTSVTKVEAT